MSTFRDSSGAFFSTSHNDEALFGHMPPQLTVARDEGGEAEGALQYPHQHTAPFLAWSDRQSRQLTSSGNVEDNYTRAEPSTTAPLPNDLRDRERLMKHITYLSSLVHRLQLELEHYRPAMAVQQHYKHDERAQGSGGAVSIPSSSPAALLPQFGLTALAAEELQRRFDPLVAEAQLSRLDNTLAQQSLLREADAMRIASLEQAQDQLHAQVSQWKQRFEESDTALQAAREWEVVAASRGEELRELQSEVGRLRRTERRLVGNLRKLKQHLGQHPVSSENDSSDDDALIRARESTQPSTPSRQQEQQWAPLQHSAAIEQHHRYQRLFFDMDEAAARQDLLVEELCFGPLQYALHMAVAYDTELQSFRGIGDEYDVGAPADGASIGLVVGDSSEAIAPLHSHAGAATLHNTSTASSSRHEQQQAALTVAQQLESLKQSYAYLEIQHSRMERLLDGERRRNQLLASDHCSQLEQIQHHLSNERKEYLERLAVEVRHAFREGMLREKANRRARRAAGSAPGSITPSNVASVASSNTSLVVPL
jgi:hypothetical protein